MKAQLQPHRSVESAPTISIGYMRNGDPGEVLVGIAYAYRPLLEGQDLTESRGMRAVISLALYAGRMTADAMTKSTFRKQERDARRFLTASVNPDNKRLAGYVLRYAKGRAIKDRVIGKRSRPGTVHVMVLPDIHAPNFFAAIGDDGTNDGAPLQ